jgi:hypothetical protein
LNLGGGKEVQNQCGKTLESLGVFLGQEDRRHAEDCGLPAPLAKGAILTKSREELGKMKKSAGRK